MAGFVAVSAGAIMPGIATKHQQDLQQRSISNVARRYSG